VHTISVPDLERDYGNALRNLDLVREPVESLLSSSRDFDKIVFPGASRSLRHSSVFRRAHELHWLLRDAQSAERV
jgi:hypothetical protein